jgi:hypothetical protein
MVRSLSFFPHIVKMGCSPSVTPDASELICTISTYQARSQPKHSFEQNTPSSSYLARRPAYSAVSAPSIKLCCSGSNMRRSGATKPDWLKPFSAVRSQFIDNPQIATNGQFFVYPPHVPHDVHQSGHPKTNRSQKRRHPDTKQVVAAITHRSATAQPGFTDDANRRRAIAAKHLNVISKKAAVLMASGRQPNSIFYERYCLAIIQIDAADLTCDTSP